MPPRRCWRRPSRRRPANWGPVDGYNTRAPRLLRLKALRRSIPATGVRHARARQPDRKERGVGDAPLRVPVREMPEAVRAHPDHPATREGQADVPLVQGDEGDAAARGVHGADEEEELSA